MIFAAGVMAWSDVASAETKSRCKNVRDAKQQRQPPPAPDLHRAVDGLLGVEQPETSG